MSKDTHSSGEGARDKKGRYLKGRVFTAEERKSLSERRKREFADGIRKPSYNWLGKKLSRSTRKKISETHKGKIVSLETRTKLSQSTKQQWEDPLFRKRVVEANTGAKSPAWRGGISTLTMRIRNSSRMQSWRQEVKKRDGQKCIECGVTTNLEVDHIRPYSLIINEQGINSVEKAWDCEELWDTDNGRTLCVEHHRKLPRPNAYTYAK